MKTKNQNPHELLKGKEVSPLLEFYFELNHLKQLFRQGWLVRGIPETKAESVADHLFGASILTLFIADIYFPKLDKLKLLRMSLVHELGEIYVGDITPSDHIPKEVKYNYEFKSVLKIFSKLPNSKEYTQLWKEYEEQSSDLAKILRQIDVLEAALQSIIYRLQYKNKSVEDFIPWTLKRISDKRLVGLLNEAKQLLDDSNRT